LTWSSTWRRGQDGQVRRGLTRSKRCTSRFSSTVSLARPFREQITRSWSNPADTSRCTEKGRVNPVKHLAKRSRRSCGERSIDSAAPFHQLDVFPRADYSRSRSNLAKTARRFRNRITGSRSKTHPEKESVDPVKAAGARSQRAWKTGQAREALTGSTNPESARGSRSKPGRHVKDAPEKESVDPVKEA
jgi:hypothetical protein